MYLVQLFLVIVFECVFCGLTAGAVATHGVFRIRQNARRFVRKGGAKLGGMQEVAY